MTTSSNPTKWGRLDFTDVRELRGPLLVLGGVRDVGWDESAVVRLDGDDVRHGVVLEVDQDLAVIQVMEGTERHASERNGGVIRRPAPPDSRRHGLARPRLQRSWRPTGWRTDRCWESGPPRWRGTRSIQ